MGIRTVDHYVANFRTSPYRHQVEGVRRLLEHEAYGLFDEMGLGKTKQVIDTACILREEGLIDTVIIVSPASVRGVWINADMGEIKKHTWVSSRVCEYHANRQRWLAWQDADARLDWVVTNYEFIRGEKNINRSRLLELLAGRRFLMVLDESSFIKNRQAAQTRACVELGRSATRRIILNGTPITNSPLDLWSQLMFLSPRILPFPNYFSFRAAFAVLGGWHNKQVLRWQNLDRFQELVAPHVVRREKKDCLDLPEKIYTQLEARLTPGSWATYKQMRDEAVVWMGENPTLAAQAGVRVMRLSQITSGFLGGFISEDVLEPRQPPRVIGAEKLNCLCDWVQQRLTANPETKIIVWCRFRAEIERASRELAALLPTYRLYGEQTREEREKAINYFSRPELKGPALLAAQPQAGGFGLNLVAADTVVYLSNDFNLMTRLQSEDRVHRPGQTKNVVYVDILATGPNGQGTVDQAILKALRKKEDLARWTVSAWKEALTEED